MMDSVVFAICFSFQLYNCSKFIVCLVSREFHVPLSDLPCFDEPEILASVGRDVTTEKD